MNRLTFHGHACASLHTSSGHRLMFDPWLDNNPASAIKVKDVASLDYILCSHGHFDHFGDAIALCMQTGATLIGTFELVSFAMSKGVKGGHGMNLGGGFKFPFGYTKLTPALHSGSIEGADGLSSIANGFLLDLGGTRFYHAGDSGLIKDFELLNGRVDVALLPIGDNYTMGPDDAVRAVEMIRPRVVIPIHYNTFDLIRQDAHAFAKAVGTLAEVCILQPGDSYEF